MKIQLVRETIIPRQAQEKKKKKMLLNRNNYPNPTINQTNNKKTYLLS